MPIRVRFIVGGLNQAEVLGFPNSAEALKGGRSGSLIDVIGYSATGSLYAAAGFVAMTAIAVRWRADLWPVHAPANAR